VNASNLDYGEIQYWDVVVEAQRALDTGKPDRVYDILLASSAVPGAFPPREIDGRLFVDGAVTGNIVYGALPREDSFVAQWMRAYPDVSVPKIRYWIIFNNPFLPPPESVQPRWTSILPRSTRIAMRSSSISSIRHLIALAENSRLKLNRDVE